MTNKIFKDTSGDEIRELDGSRLSPYKCECGGDIYYNTRHVIVFGDFTRTAFCQKCNQQYQIESRTEYQTNTSS